MKKLILSSLAMASLAFAAHAVTYMRVHTSDGKVVKYDVEHVTKVYYEETSDGVTVSGKEGIYTYVDLGLPSGTKWATCNVGASKPAERGDYFAWGETKPKEDYNYDTYKWRKGYYLTKYGTDVDNKTVLDAEDDAATANWGSAWRMPTREEIEELRDGCEWEWVEDFYGSGVCCVSGKLGTSKRNGATIFLPADGFLNAVGCIYSYDQSLYWSSSLTTGYSDKAYVLYFSGPHCGYSSRYGGLLVRAVLR